MRALALTALALFSVVSLAACGGGPGANQPPGSIKVSLTEFAFTPSALTARQGRVVFFLVNDGSQSHDLVITDSAGKRIAASELLSAGDSNVFTVDNIATGSYIILCDQPGHEASGMKGSLTVS